ncbi:thiol-disulfide oxidoreductase [Pseudoroseomonas deserti]|uniref:Thiol-disulfide oxidoreductase n=1 Tax=Teichococcus deserti TaxID=1817963 RepID=A0A1V2H487_9PROT|nr:DCC1-like thiol-disulfide oxidoreductase family protein [Pseudoroseomonas deserti]ONG55829.1 thiol-disulfide oxidoreductase [Pseudoroseomonas deserti]
MTAAGPPVLIFDGDCALCDGVVRFVLRHERDDRLRFASAWSAAGLALAATHGLTREDLRRSFLYVGDGRALTRSAAALALARHLRAPWSGLRLLGALPRPLRDGVYDRVARHRLALFGRVQHCLLPSPEQRHRFLDLGERQGR